MSKERNLGQKVTLAGLRVGAALLAAQMSFGIDRVAHADINEPVRYPLADGRLLADAPLRTAGRAVDFTGPHGLWFCGTSTAEPTILTMVAHEDAMNSKVIGNPDVFVDPEDVGGSDYPSRAAAAVESLQNKATELINRTNQLWRRVAVILTRDAVNQDVCDLITDSGPFAPTAAEASAAPPARAEARVEVAALPPPAVPGCPPAEQIGIVPRNKDGTGHMIEFTAARGPLHTQIFLPEGLRPDGQPLVINGQVVGKREMSVVFETGNSWEVVNGGGTGWDYPEIYNDPQCRGVFDAEVTADRVRRAGLTNFFGPVRVEDLVAQGVLRNRRVMLAQQANLAALPVSQAGCPPATFRTENEPFHDVTLGERSSYSAYWRDNDFDLGREVQGTVPAGQPARTLLQVAGTTYNYAASCTTEQIQAQVRASAQAAGFRIADIDELIRAGRAR